MRPTLFCCLLLVGGFAFSQNDPCAKGAKFDVNEVQGEHQLPSAPEGKAILVVVREGSGAHRTLGVAVDDKWVGALGDHTWFATPIEPGAHTLCSTGGVMRTHLKPGYLTFHAEAGKTYFVGAQLPFDDIRVNLHTVDEAQGLAEVKSGNRSELARVK